MNLTVESLESMHQECVDVIESGMLTDRLDMLEEAKAVRDQLDLACGMLRDLQISIESLKEVGANDEWMSIVNKDNKFVIACNIELPKFFGGEKARTDACLEGAWETFRGWLDKAWKIIKTIFEYIVKGIKAILIFLNRQQGKSFAENVENIEKAFAEGSAVFTEELNITTVDPVVLKRYIEELGTFIALLISKSQADGPLNPATIAWGKGVETDPLTGSRTRQFEAMTGTPSEDVPTMLTTALAALGIPQDKNFYGYVLTRKGIEFVDPKAICQVTYAFTENDQLDAALALCKLRKPDHEAGRDAEDKKRLMNELLETLTRAFRNFTSMKESAKTTAKPEVLIELEVCVQRLREFYNIVSATLGQYWRLLSTAEALAVKINNSFAELRRKYPEKFK